MASKKKPRRRTRRHRGRGLNPLYVMVPALVVVLASGIWLLTAQAKPSAPSESPQFPAWVQAKGPKAQQAYAQAVAHREDLQYIPCYCGCGNLGHRAVVDCHVASVSADGSITYEQHAAT